VNHDLNRRDMLKVLGLGAGGAAILAAGGCGTGGPTDRRATGAVLNPARSRVVRICHFTDSHIRPEHNAVLGVQTAWQHVMNQPDRPDVVVLGGDNIMFSMDQTEQTTAGLWDLWTRVQRDYCGLPVIPCLGNHDIWGWNKERSRTTGDEPRWGKRWASEIFQQERFYQQRDFGNWSMLVLDSIQPAGTSYEGRLDEEQFSWLESRLSALPQGQHVCVVSHIPIMNAGSLATDTRPIRAGLAELTGDPRDDGGGLLIGKGSMHMDMHRLLEAFSKRRQVRVCLSGHIHTLDRIDFDGISYCCSGAVSGMWWRNAEAYQERLRTLAPGGPPRPNRANSGYAMVDLFSDGSFTHEYAEFPWVAAGARG
jgi:3',5'-cyclic-AMP phosphodiesterase